jgi:hypothetical protein
MTSKRVMQIQVVHSDRDALEGIITDLVEERLIALSGLGGRADSSTVALDVS